MSITDDQAKEWAEYFIRQANESYEYSNLYEDEDFTEDYPDSDDWEKVHDLMSQAKLKIVWDD